MEEQISEYLKGKGEDIDKDLRDGKPLDSILNDFFLSNKCIDIDYSKKEMKLNFDIFNHQPDQSLTPKPKLNSRRTSMPAVSFSKQQQSVKLPTRCSLSLVSLNKSKICWDPCTFWCQILVAFEDTTAVELT